MSNIKTLIRQLAKFPFTKFTGDGAPEFMPIVPSSRLWLPRLGIGDDKRFAAIFRDTWPRIPLKARRLMVNHWRKSEPIWAIQGFWSPMIQLADDWEFSDRTVRHPKDFAACGRNGHSLFFYAPLVDAMPGHHIQELIAHELAHVIQYALGEPSSTDRTLPRWCDEAESHADEIMELWDFDPWAMDDWIDANWTWPSEG